MDEHLKARLWELLLIQGEVAQQALPFVGEEVGYPRTQLTALGQTLLALEIQVRDTLAEARVAYRELQQAGERPHLRVVA